MVKSKLNFSKPELEALGRWLLRNKLDFAALAERLGVPVDAVKKWFSTNTLPPPDCCQRIYRLTELELFQNFGPEKDVEQGNLNVVCPVQRIDRLAVTACPTTSNGKEQILQATLLTAVEGVSSSDLGHGSNSVAHANGLEPAMPAEPVNGLKSDKELPPVTRKLYQWLKKSGLTRHQLAKKISANTATVYRWFDLARIPDSKYSKRLYEVTGIDDFNTEGERMAPRSMALPKVEESKDVWLERAYAQLNTWMQTNAIDWKTLGNRLGAPRPTVWGWSHNRCRPSPKYFQKLYALTNIAEFQPLRAASSPTEGNDRSTEAVPAQNSSEILLKSNEQPIPPAADGANGEALGRLAAVESHSLTLLLELSWFVFQTDSRAREAFRCRLNKTGPLLVRLLNLVMDESERDAALREGLRNPITLINWDR